MRVRYKVWLENDSGEPIISEGKYRLLKEVEEKGSILKAAKSLGISYKRAHSQIKAIEERAGFPVVYRKRRKGAELTQAGRKLVSKYESVMRAFQKAYPELSLE